MKPIKFPLRLNMRRDTVADLHDMLTALNIDVDDADKQQQRYGKSTRDAVSTFQKTAGLSVTGEVDAKTARALMNRAKQKSGMSDTPIYRVRGTLRDERDRPIGRRTVRVYHKTLTDEILLGEKTSYDNGFYDIAFPSPAGKKSAKQFNIVVKTFDDHGQLVAASPVVFRPRSVTWVNFNAADRPYRGTSTYEHLLKDLRPHLGDVALTDLAETDDNKQITYLAKETRRTAQELMSIVMSAQLESRGPLPAEVWFAFLGRNAPVDLPGDLLEASIGLTRLDPLLDAALDGILALGPDLQRATLEKALQDNTVPQPLADEVDTILEELAALGVARAMARPFQVGKAPLGDVLQTTTLNANQQERFVAMLTRHQGTADEFWSAVAESAELDDAAVAEVRATLDLGLITKNHLPFLTFVKGQIGNDGGPASVRDLAKLDLDDWLVMIQSAQDATAGKAIPENLDGADDQDLAEVYATVLMDRAEAAFPTTAIAARSQDNLIHGQDIVTFVDGHPDFELRTMNVDRYLSGLDEATDDPFSSPGETVREMKALQRALWLTGKPRHAAALVKTDLTSAGKVASLTSGQFLELATSAGFTTAEANQTYTGAVQRYASALARYGEYNLGFGKGSPAAIIKPPWNPEVDLSGAPTLEILFGSLDFCRCEHCNSVLSPAAYLVDVLRFLGLKAAETGGDTARDALFERRPDLGHIKLSCQNTNTVLPYIDLVCEILEEEVHPSGVDFQSTISSEELRAHPEYVNADAYQDLKAALYPMTMPFDLWVEEARVYLRHLKIPRHDLMRVLQAPTGPTNAEIAAEYLGLTPVDAALTTTADPGNQAAYWGTANPVADLENVAAFLDHAKLDYDELIDLLLVRWVNPLGATEIHRPADDCDVDQQTLTNLDANRLDRMHRFLRLWRATDWEEWELDLLVRAPAVGNAQLNATTLERLRGFHELQDKLKLKTEELLAFYQDINTEIRVTPDGEVLPLYHRLFLNRTVTNPTNPAFELAQITTAPAAAFTDHLETVLAAVAIRQTDLDLLTPADGELTISNLSAIYRFATLARSLRISVADLLRLGEVRQIADPFADLDATQLLVEDVETMRARRATPEQLAYLLRHEPDSPTGMSDALVAQRVQSIRAARFEVQIEYAASDDTLVEVVRRGLQRFDVFQDPADLDTGLRIIEGSWDIPVDGSPALSDAERIAFINSHFDRFADAAGVAAALGPLVQPPGPGREAEIEGRRRWVLERFHAHFGSNGVKGQVATAFGLENGQADVLLRQLELVGQPGVSLLQHLLDPALTAIDAATGEFAHPLTAAKFPRIFETMVLLHKAAQVVSTFAITPDDLAWLVEHGPTFGAINFGALPVAAGPAVEFDRWRALSWLIDFKSRFPEPPEGSLFDILEMVEAADPEADALDALAVLTGWDRDDLDTVTARIGLQHPGDYTDIATYRRLGAAFALHRRAGVAASVLSDWADNAVQPSHAQEIKQAAKSKHSVEQWPAISTALQDEVRELKRAALVDYLVAHPRDKDPGDPSKGKAWADANGLFGYFLIDVEMTSCFLTSRLKQAISSVQLFVQRCLLNLEKDRVVAHPGRGWEQWKWMKNYRVWEANRKVFLYPENWIEPELRDDKTPFFLQLENELLQDEITDANVERAFRGYVANLNGVSRLEVMGVYHQVEPGVSALHVLARTRETPHVYYRRRLESSGHWSAWEHVDVEIEAEQVIPVVVNRKLHLFWLEFRQMPEQQKSTPPPPPLPSGDPAQKLPPQKSPEQPMYSEIQLAWTAFDNGAWIGKRLGTRKLIHPWLRPEFSYHLRTRSDPLGRVHIDIHLNSSREFNEAKFYDPLTDSWRRLTDTPFDENEWPWHSSSFVFDGDVAEVRINDINGSYQRVRGGYGEAGRQIQLIGPSQKRPRLKQPLELHFDRGRIANQEDNLSKVNVLVESSQRVDSGQLLRKANPPFSLVVPHQTYQFDSVTRPFFFQDQRRAFFVVPLREWSSAASWTTVTPSDFGTRPFRVRYTFYPFYHPHAQVMTRELERAGVAGVLNRGIQVNPAMVPPASTFAFDTEYDPQPLARPVTQGEVMDFSYAGAYSQYNWEMFFHAPLLIADRLRRNQRFEEALRWFHFIFDPTSASADPVPKRYWITKPFYEFNSTDYQQQRIDNLLELVNRGSVPHANQVREWRENPFKPHLVARLRPVAYQRTVVMKYLDTLVEWGDQLFRRDSIESINEATQLYILAAEILGPPPTRVPPAARADDKTFLELLPDLDEFANAMAEIENTVGLPVQVVELDGDVPPLPPPEAFYFCIPDNDQLLERWDTVADRLFKIRHCMNIEGLVRQLPLFEPPIDPALLVKAAAAGIDLGSVLSEIDVALPHYRFAFMVSRAQQFANEVKQLGAALLSTLEKRDGEELAALRATHEVNIHDAVLDVRRQQIEDAKNAIQAMERSRRVVEVRLQHYEDLAYMNAWEIASTSLAGLSLLAQSAIAVGYILAGGLKLIPAFVIGASGFGGSPHAVVEPVDGDRIGDSAEAAVKTLSAIASALDKGAGLASTLAGFERRAEEWELQKEVAQAELSQIDAQIEGAKLRLEVAELEYDAQQMQLDNAKEIDEYMRSKYTNAELYEWMLSQVSSVYFQAYQLAYDIAKRAERTFRYELGLDDSSYIKFGYWDSLKKGLLAGEKLSLDLFKLEAAYLERNRRELELTKHVSLVQTAPAAFLTLKETGSCVVEIPELLFDMDFPGHYFRRLKSVSVTIPCVAGPYTGVHCTLTMLRNSVRTSNIIGGAGYDRVPNDDRFRDQLAAVQSIATSNAQNDSGLFVLDFRDERYLPFEGAGAISRWRVDLPKDANHFDFDSVADVVIHVRYTARDGGESLAAGARQSVQAALPTAGVQLLDLKRDFPNQWHAFLHPAGAGGEQVLPIEITAEHFPYFARNKTIEVTRAQLIGRMASAGDYEIDAKPIDPVATLTLTKDGVFGDAHHVDRAAPGTGWALGNWSFRIRRDGAADFASLPDDDIDELFLLLSYALS